MKWTLMMLTIKKENPESRLVSLLKKILFNIFRPDLV